MRAVPIPLPASTAFPRRALLRLASLAAAACLATACATGGSGPQRPVISRDEHGFTIVDRVKVDRDVRGEFEDALELIDQEEYAQGIALLQKVTEAAPRLTAALIDLGIAYRLSGDLEQAEKSIEAALAVNPRHPAAYNELGIVYRKTGRFEEARASYEKALAIYPDFHFARRNLAILCDVYLGDLPCAIEQYERYAQVVRDDDEVEMWITDLRNRLAAGPK
jgi:tetratricopeptide (TPR) repeat protein